jgi:RHS repeat-associated protein
VGVYVHNGEMVYSLPLLHVRGRKVDMDFAITYRSGITYNGPVGRNWEWSFPKIVEQGNGDVLYRDVYLFDPDQDTPTQRTYTSPAGFPGELVLNKTSNEWLMTFPNGYEEEFQASNTDPDQPKGGVSELGFMTRWNSGISFTWSQNRITTVTDDLNRSYTITYYGTGRIQEITDFANREVELKYNCKDQLVWVRSPVCGDFPWGRITQFCYTTDVNPLLTNNLTWITSPAGDRWLEVRYDGSDRVSRQYVGSTTSYWSFTYGTGTTTVVDPVGNQRIWSYSGPTPTDLWEYSNRNVRATDPGNWHTEFGHDSDFRRTKIVYPEGNRVDTTWNSDFQMTERRRKTTDRDTNHATDIVESWTYSANYAQVASYTDPLANQTTFTVDTSGNITQISYPTVTARTPNVSITESMTYNSYGQILTHTDGEGNVTKTTYYSSGSNNGWVESVIRDYGTGTLNLTTSWVYNSVGDWTQRTDARSNVTERDVNVYHETTKITGPSPQDYEVEYVYDPNGRLIEKNVENVDENHNRISGFEWIQTSYGYDMLGNVTSVEEDITSSTFRATGFTYDLLGNITRITKPEGNKIQRVWDERGLLYSETKGYQSTDATTSYFTYDGNRNRTVFKNGRGNEWDSTYDDFDRRTKLEDPLGHYRTWTYDKRSGVTYLKAYKSDDTLMAQRRIYYDELARPWKTEDLWDGPGLTEDTVTTEFWHDKCGNVTQVQDDNAKNLYRYFDGANRLYEVKDHLNNRRILTFDGNGNVTRVREVEVTSSGTETFDTNQYYDKYNRMYERRVVDRTDSNNYHTSKWWFGSLDQVLTFQDAEGNETDFTYDALRRLTGKSVDLGSGASEDLAITWDKNSNRTRLEDDNGNQTDYDFDACDRLEQITYEDGETETFGYDDAHNLTSYTDQNGTSVANTYDAADRLTSRAITLATGVYGPSAETFTHDALGRLTMAQNSGTGRPTIRVERTYDTLGRILSETQKMTSWTDRTMSYVYDGVGNVTRKTYPSSLRLDITSDALGRWTKLEDASSSDIATWTWMGPGRRLEELEYLNGTKVVPGYDGFRRMTDLDHKTSTSTVFAGFDYAFDKVGNKLYEERTHDSGRGEVYSYSQAYKLTQVLMDCADPSAEIASPGSQSYDHKIDYNMDVIGNRTSVVETPNGQQGTTTSYTTNAMNEYTQIALVTRTHDDNGNLTDDGTNEYAYNWRNQLVEVVRKSDAYVLGAYWHDALGRRVRKDTLNETVSTRYLYDGLHCVEERDSSGTLLRKFAFGQGIDRILWMEAPDVADVDDDSNTAELMQFYYHTSSLGSVTHLTDPNENVVEKYEYTPYGLTKIRDGAGNDLSGQSAVGNPWMYTGRRFDEETGLFNHRARSYDARAGRFLQVDPLRYSIGLNPYEYCRSRPTGLSDPTGLAPEEQESTPGKYRVAEDDPDEQQRGQEALEHACRLIEKYGSDRAKELLKAALEAHRDGMIFLPRGWWGCRGRSYYPLRGAGPVVISGGSGYVRSIWALIRSILHEGGHAIRDAGNAEPTHSIIDAEARSETETIEEAMREADKYDEEDEADKERQDTEQKLRGTASNLDPEGGYSEEDRRANTRRREQDRRDDKKRGREERTVNVPR